MHQSLEFEPVEYEIRRPISSTINTIFRRINALGTEADNNEIGLIVFEIEPSEAKIWEARLLSRRVYSAKYGTLSNGMS